MKEYANRPYNNMADIILQTTREEMSYSGDITGTIVNLYGKKTTKKQKNLGSSFKLIHDTKIRNNKRKLKFDYLKIVNYSSKDI